MYDCAFMFFLLKCNTQFNGFIAVLAFKKTNVNNLYNCESAYFSKMLTV